MNKSILSCKVVRSSRNVFKVRHLSFMTNVLFQLELGHQIRIRDLCAFVWAFSFI